ncbi:MAG TPA: protease inhibitor I42 family protein [Pyrinomonadaceae bacterium]|nr:protease inhibitor I42 family protein [Pyrinomonadaceae bacterium]
MYAVTLACLALLLNTGAVNSPLAVVPADHTVEIVDNGKEVQLARGDSLNVRLPAQLGTGYGWYVTSGPGRRLQHTNQRPKIETNKDSTPGSSEVEVFQFVARRSGRVSLAFRYGRPRNTATLKTFHITVVIQ